MDQLPPRSSPDDLLLPTPSRPPYRPPVGIPIKRQRKAGSFLLAVFLHILVILLFIVPFTSPEMVKEIVLGAGGAGPSGGGGGGRQGTGGSKTERLQYVNVVPPPPAPVPVPPVVKPPEVKPVVPPPVPPPPTPKPEVPVAPPAQPAAPVTEVKSAVPGTGGGAGNDGSAGAGPGSGGGVGSGIGTGRGAGVGPGTGGGNGSIYPPAMIGMFVPPMPVPSKARGEILVTFDVDSTGKVIDFEFTQTRDSGYNRKLKEVLADYKFRPGVNGQGIPVRAKVQIGIKL